jgi:O-antigen/teichoic acid export membrane protein/CelD/BcsL family acetyltransferase involved in cellulose biosynthesis
MLAETWSSFRRRTSLLDRFRAQQVSLAVLDQGASSFSSLALQVALVALLGPQEFGSYAVAASIQGVAYLIVATWLLEPLPVLGAQQKNQDERTYLVRVLAALVVASLSASAVLAVAALISGQLNERLAFAMLGGSLALPGITLGWFARGVAYLRSRSGLALVNSLTTSVLLLTGIVGLYATDLLSAGSGLLLLGLASGAAALLPLREMAIGVKDTCRTILDGSWWAIVREHRPLAKWGLLTAFSVYAFRDLYAPLLAAAGGLELAALHRAATLLVLPFTKLGVIVSLVLQPVASRAAVRWSRVDVKRILRWIFAGCTALGLAAALLLWPSLPPAVRLLFPDPVYSGHAVYFYVVALTTLVFVLVDASVNVMLRAKRRFDLVFWPAFAAGAVAGVLGIIGVWIAGLDGAAAALVASTVVFVPSTVAACLVMLRSEQGGRDAPDAPSKSAAPADAGACQIYGEVVEGSRFERLEPELRDLALRAVEPNPFQDHAFIGAFCKHQRQNVYLALAWRKSVDGARLIGAAAFLAGKSRIGLSTAVLTAPLSAALAFLGTPLVDGELISEALRAMLDAIARDPKLPKSVVIVDLTDGPVLAALLPALAARGKSPVVLDRRQRPMLSAEVDASSYFNQSMSAASRKKLRQHRRRLAQHGPVETVTHAGPQAACAAFERFLAMEAAGWKGRSGTAILCNDLHAAIARDFFSRMAAADRAWVEALHVGGRIASAQVLLRSGRAAFTWKIAYDEAFAEYSPGVLLLEDFSAKLLADPTIDFTDSCSHGDGGFMAELWRERRQTVDLMFDLRRAGSPAFDVAAGAERLYVAVQDARARLGTWRRRSFRHLASTRRNLNGGKQSAAGRPS